MGYTPRLPPAVEADDEGQFYLDPELPDGNYLVTLDGMGMQRQTTSIALQNGTAVCSFFDNFYGDLLHDGHINGMDIPLIVKGLLEAP